MMVFFIFFDKVPKWVVKSFVFNLTSPPASHILTSQLNGVPAHEQAERSVKRSTRIT
jgi:hypothetical protein